MKITFKSDGASRGNPGHSGIGAIWYDENGQILGEYYMYIGDKVTNNIAEWQALEIGINELCEHISPNSVELSIKLDSQLVVKQLQALWKIRNDKIQEINDRVRLVLRKFSAWEIDHIPRNKNGAADALANKAIDEKLCK